MCILERSGYYAVENKNGKLPKNVNSVSYLPYHHHRPYPRLPQRPVE